MRIKQCLDDEKFSNLRDDLIGFFCEYTKIEEQLKNIVRNTLEYSDYYYIILRNPLNEYLSNDRTPHSLSLNWRSDDMTGYSRVQKDIMPYQGCKVTITILIIIKPTTQREVHIIFPSTVPVH